MKPIVEIKKLDLKKYKDFKIFNSNMTADYTSTSKNLNDFEPITNIYKNDFENIADYSWRREDKIKEEKILNYENFINKVKDIDIRTLERDVDD